MNKGQQRLVDLLTKELEEGNLALFTGAGFSRPAGYVDWKTLLEPLANDLDLDIEKEWDLVTLAQYHSNENQSNRARINQLLISEFCSDLKPTENHKIISRLPIGTYWTTNYDNLIESALIESGKIPDVKFTTKQLTTTRPGRDAVIYKMHGDSAHPADAVLTRDDYERYHIKMEPFITALKGDLVSKTFLFLGFSFTDPNLEYILSRVRIQYGKDQRQHHCILKQVVQDENESLADYEYRKRKQKLFEGELLRVGIKTTWVSDFNEITLILNEIEKKHKKNTVFISGAAHEYGKWPRDEAEKFVFELSRKISRNDFRIMSGFGLGVGSAVISGVIEETSMSGKRLNEDRLIVRPFPQSQSGEKPLSDLWKEYRCNILDRAGIAIFIFGNKIENEEVMISNGMIEEYHIACERGVFIIPVGATGYASRQIWNDYRERFDTSSHEKGSIILSILNLLNDDEQSLVDIEKNIIKLLNIMK